MGGTKSVEQNHTYFLFDQCVHIGKVYNLPRNVRVLMPCNGMIGYNKFDLGSKAKILQSCFVDVNDDKYMDKLTNFCVYDGNSQKHNRVPDFAFF